MWKTAIPADTRTMDERVALENARECLDQHGLEGWEVVIDRRPLRRLGQTRYSTQEIGLSLAYVELNPWEVVRETVLHEMAHALVGPGYGHGPVWKAKARALGMRNPRAAIKASDAAMPVSRQGRILVTCPTHGLVTRKVRMPKRQYRHTCGQVVTFTRT